MCRLQVDTSFWPFGLFTQEGLVQSKCQIQGTTVAGFSHYLQKGESTLRESKVVVQGLTARREWVTFRLSADQL